MSGFGIRALRKVSEENKKIENSIFIKHLVVGENSYAILSFLKLNRKYPGEVKLISKNPFFKEDLIHEWDCTLSSFRSPEVAEAFIAINPRLEIFKTTDEVLFYKDTKFHKFGGRAKPHQLKNNENFFKAPNYNISLEAFFEGDEFDNMDETLREHQLNKIIANIEVTDPSDLVDQQNFKVETGESESYSCEKIYWCESPKKLLNLIQNKSHLNDSVYAFAAGINAEQAIAVHFKCSKQVFDKSCTILIPQSMTHEWGSFILEFEAYNPETQTQNFKALMFVSEDDLQEEDLAKKIKLMKRVIERVFPDFSKAEIDQKIRFSDEYYLSGINDGLYAELKEANVQFLGQSSPLNLENSESFQYVARAMYAMMTNDL
jgi:hypothetical protein